MIQLIATDMDGTLLDDTGYLDRDYLEKVLDRLEKKGMLFCVASGNGLARLLAITGDLADRILFVADNGARVYYRGEDLYRHQLSNDLIEEVISYYQERLKTLCFMLQNDEAIYMAKGSARPFVDFDAIAPEQMVAFYDKISFLEEMKEFSRTAPYYKMGLWVKEDQVAEVVAECNRVFAGKLEAVTSGFGSIDLLPLGINKATGLQKLLTAQDLNSSHLMAFGDNDNDLEMLELAQVSYAVGESSNRIKEVADHWLANNADAAVLRAITAFLDRRQEREIKKWIGFE